MPAKLSLLTSVNAVKEAIAECDQIGRAAFLKKYGFSYSRLYPLHYQGHTYDSKAIAGVAFGKQHGTPLGATEFSGGADTVVPVLRGLKFSVTETPHPVIYLIKGTTYLRKELLEQFGGQLQRGIWTPKEFPVVFIFTGDSGHAYGYRDGWTDEGVFQYTGEGQSGDMTFTTGNKAIRDHRENGKDLLLFEDLGKGKGVRYAGLFECASWAEIEGIDKEKKKRNLIVFNLVPVSTVATDGEGLSSQQVSQTSPLSLAELRRAAYMASKTGKVSSKTGSAKSSWYERSIKVRDYVLARARGVCEACNQKAPFKRKDGSPYLEPHHTTRLADDGPDHPGWVGAICPTCHRRIHSGEDGSVWNKNLQRMLEKKEANIAKSVK